MNTEFIEYSLGNLVMEGFLAIGESTLSTQPLVMVVHDWTGNRSFAQEKAQYFAKQGFVAFAVDLYGKGKRGNEGDRSGNEKLLNELLQDRSVIIPRLHAALKCASDNTNVDSKKIMLLGFCMGGLCALDYARSGADVAGVVSIHGILQPAEHAKNKKITAKVLVLHGHEDPSVTPQHVQAFETEMTECKADWQVHVFGNTHHAFTNPKVNEPGRGLIYSSTADGRTWPIVRAFTDEIFA